MYCFVTKDETKPLEAIIIATGTEVTSAIVAAKTIKKNIRVVSSMPCVELFEQQPRAYQEKIVPKNITKVIAIEFSNDYVWYKFVGKTGLVLGVDD